MANKTDEQFRAEVEHKFPHIDVLSEYTGSNNIMTFKCKKHDNIFTKTAYSLIHSKYGCNLCAKDYQISALKKSPDWFHDELQSTNPKVEQISEYLSMQDKIKVRCVFCGNTFESKAQDLLNGHYCRSCAIKECSKDRIKSHDWFISEVKKHNVNYKNIDILGEYTGVKNNIKCRCKKCSYEWETKASLLIDKRGGSGCPMCNQSKGESMIYNYLIDNHIDFEHQKSFPNLNGVSGYPLLYDFYIPSKKLLVEVNGLQHYVPVQHFGGAKRFKTQQEHDRRKRLFANKNGYRLLEIEYCSSYELGNVIKILQANL